MPFRSLKQKRWMYANKPKLAAEWEDKYGSKVVPSEKKGVTKVAGKGKHSKAHPGFQSVVNTIAKKQGISKKRAGAIIASKTRGASPAAKKANPRLKRVRMPKKK
jgi:hypothetical protein